ncbi:CHS_3a_G0038800.mRNA.1.CDS.1 [Saccharomyces cerevisiae]|nr:ABA_G0039910.mRNA.1.CDS.1 [Saccharomyces cerevisiae]CAI4893156.1 CHS_3a_G0038800.mRNA.1.CDS.1 [Saccharomyces cerevisiae]CAI6831028.1 ABA_G0039910.mRNA.1.CDS.1 [Saccharomyces cerevisiae]CAI7417404.1 CHS_3a_G0038800.mRNA.1.CDS.1 [Saccharomyces cerevisiae]
MPRNDSNQYYARWCCYRRPIRAAFAPTAIDYGSPQSIEISEIGAVMHQMSCERLSLSLFSRFACLLARLKTCVLLIN